MIVNKITTGFVIQCYDTDTKECVGQMFVAGDVEWEKPDGTPISPIGDEHYQPFDMVQP